MSWERDPLWAKAKVYFERAFSQPRDEPEFGLWCSLGLELLARAAVASISPTLLAKPDESHKYLLHALGRGSERDRRVSIQSAEVLQLCRTLFKEFTEDNKTSALALLNRRNEELHSGANAFGDYPSGQWLGGFYRTCTNLCAAMGETLVNLFGPEEAKSAQEILSENDNDLKQRVLSRIAAHAKVFAGRPPGERDVIKAETEAAGVELARQRHHRVLCPACKCTGTVQGTAFGKEFVTYGEREIIIKQAVRPATFHCTACDLRLAGYGELSLAGIGNDYMRTTTTTPELFFGLYNEDDLNAELEARLPEAFQDYAADQMQEYDNEG
jgi:hypothetical protein